MLDLTLRLGWVEQELAEEFPELALVHTTAAGRRERSPRAVKERLRAMSDRYTGRKAVQVRQQPVPWAYRVFYRQIGIDPDVTRPAPEALALERMRAGHFRSRDVVHDALVIATVETGVPLVALDADRVSGEPGLRPAFADERIEGDERELRAGELVLADSERALAPLFGEPAGPCAVGRESKRVLLAAPSVKGVPAVSVEEALWTAAEILSEPG